MFQVRRNWLAFAIVIASAVLAAGCTSMRGGQSGLSAPAVAAGSLSATAPIKGARARFAFAAVDGAPVNVLQELSTALNKEAVATRLPVVPAGDPSATYQVKGYLSAIGDRTSTKLIYVWDVLDAKGTRIHRISGQENGAGATSDPWSGIQPATIDVAARQTISALAAWIKEG